jgi:peptidoglycan hydrolase CwlO-like protein
VPIIIPVIFAIGLIGSIAFGADQYYKRQKAEAEIRDLRNKLQQHMAELAEAEARYGKLSQQYRALAAEIDRLRAELARRAA